MLVWYDLKSSQYEVLEQVDEYLLRKILNAHSKTPKEMLYLETGAIPIRFVIQNRRLSYLHHILTRNKNELISKVNYAQKRRPVRDDWSETVKNDIVETGLKLNEDDIRQMKRDNFTKVLKKKVRLAAYKYLIKIKDGHSKVKIIVHENLEGQKYIKCYKVRPPEKQLIFKLRSRMTNVKANFKSMYENLECNLCEKSTLQTDAHLLDCEALIQKCKTLANNYNAEYEDVFGIVMNRIESFLPVDATGPKHSFLMML